MFGSITEITRAIIDPKGTTEGSPISVIIMGIIFLFAGILLFRSGMKKKDL